MFVNFGTLDEHRGSNPQGRGLGLTICKSIIEKMGGRIRVESILGQGTSFIMTLRAKCQPRKISVIEESKVESERIVFFEKNPSLHKLYDDQAEQIDTTKFRILLVNDEPF